MIVVATLIAAASSYWYISREPALYQTTTTLMVGRVLEDPNPSGNDFNISGQLAETYARMVTTDPILSATAEALELEYGAAVLRQQVYANAVPRTQLLNVAVADNDPARAQQIANEIANQLILQSPTTPDSEQSENREFVNQQITALKTKIAEAEDQIPELEERLTLETSARGIESIQGQISALESKINLWQTNYANLLSFYEGGRTNYLSVVAPAYYPTDPVGPRIWYNVALAGAFGFLLAVGGAYLIEYLNETLESKEDVEQAVGLATLGSITRIHDVKQPTDNLVTLNKPHVAAAESYRFLRTSILFSGLTHSPLILLVTSANVGEGKTTIAANLAVIMARAGKKVVLIDTDLRKPNQHRLFGISNSFGLTSLLLDQRRSVESVAVETSVQNLRLIPSGPLPPNPAELLLSQPMQKRLTQFSDLADIIIFDSPPVLAVDDATILSTFCDGVILVVDSTRTRGGVVRRSKEALERVGANILGVALNKLSVRRSGYNYHHYSYLAEEADVEATPARTTTNAPRG